MSAKANAPLTAPVCESAVPTLAGALLWGWPGSTGTVTVCEAVCTPLLTVIVNESVVDAVAACRWLWVGA